MEKENPVNRVPFYRLINLFKKRSVNRFVLVPPMGEGYVQIFELEKGLQARFWDCRFNEEIEMYSDVSAQIESAYFTLAFFLNTEGLQFGRKGTFLQENVIWDTVFISAASNYTILIAPKARGHCLSISFSKRWLTDNLLKDNEAFKNLRENIEKTKSFSLLQSMTSSEKKFIHDLLEASWEKTLGSFYIKSAVLKIISDFFYTIKQRETLNTNNISMDISMVEVERYLRHHLTRPLPNLKDLARKFSVSESTLKRRFKKKYGVNMSTYFIKKKMEYAQRLINEKNRNVRDTALILGYKNTNNFISQFRKHMKSLMALI